MPDPESLWHGERSRRAHSTSTSSCLQAGAVSGQSATPVSLWRITGRSGSDPSMFARTRKVVKRCPDWSVRHILAWAALGFDHQKQLRWEVLRGRFLTEYTVGKQFLVLGSVLASTESLGARGKLYLMKGVSDEIEKWATALPKVGRTDSISRTTYLWLYRRIVNILLPCISEDDAMMLVVTDWLQDTRDSVSTDTISKPQFKWALLGLATVWVESGTEGECVEFIRTLRVMIQTERPSALSYREADLTPAVVAAAAQRMQLNLNSFHQAFASYNAARGAGGTATARGRTHPTPSAKAAAATTTTTPLHPLRQAPRTLDCNTGGGAAGAPTAPSGGDAPPARSRGGVGGGGGGVVAPAYIPVHQAAVWCVLLGSSTRSGFAALDLTSLYYSDYATAGAEAAAGEAGAGCVRPAVPPGAAGPGGGVPRSGAAAQAGGTAKGGHSGGAAKALHQPRLHRGMAPRKIKVSVDVDNVKASWVHMPPQCSSSSSGGGGGIAPLPPQAICPQAAHSVGRAGATNGATDARHLSPLSCGSAQGVQGCGGGGGSVGANATGLLLFRSRDAVLTASRRGGSPTHTLSPAVAAASGT